MIIKKFQAKTEEEALVLARAELGDNVVVLNVKKDVKPKGFLSFLKSKLVEVTVAKEEESELAARNEAKDIRETIASVDKLRTLTEEKKEQKEQPREAVSTAPAGKASDSTNHSSVVSTEVTKKLDSIQSLLEEKLQKNEQLAKSVVQESTQEGNSDKKEADSEEASATEKEIENFLKLLKNTMIENEVDEKYAQQMIDEIEQSFEKDTQMEYILSYIYQKMILKFGKTESITPSEKKGPKVIFFIGPTGVGKTTTLAKIASQLFVMEHKKLALITVDTYRIGATTQLETYAKILGTPFHVVYTKEELAQHYDVYRNYDYILIDTAGHSHYNEEQRKNMEEFVGALDGVAEKEVYLVLSASTKYRDLISAADAYKEIGDYKLIFTKLDETTTYGNILNLRIHTQAPISYVTCGQNVPDDIEKFSPQDTVRKLLGGNAAE